MKGKIPLKRLSKIDQAAESKGSSAIVTVWQFVKFTFVSLLATIVQFSLLNLIKLIPTVIRLSTVPFNWFVFNYPVETDGFGGLGYFIAFNVANISAQIVAFFVNRKKTFNANNNIPLTLSIYIVFTLLLISFSALLSPNLNKLFLSLNLNATLSMNLSTFICSAIQFLLYFPVDKLLMRKKDK